MILEHALLSVLPDRENDFESAFAEAFASAFKNLARVESDKARRALKKPNEYLAWTTAFTREHRERVRSELAPLITAYQSVAGRAATPGTIDAVVTHYANGLITRLKTADPDVILNTSADTGPFIRKLTEK